MTRQVNLRLSDELYERVEAARGDLPRERWLRRAVERALDERAPVHRPAPAEQPPRRLASSGSVKRDVRPILKGKR